MAYDQKFGPSRKGSKHSTDMISRIMSGKDTADDYSYAVPAEKLKDIQKSEGLSREGSKPDYIDIDGDGDKKESMKSASKGISREGSDPKPKTEKMVRSNPSTYFNSFKSKATQRTAKNPYPKESVNFRAFAKLQKKLEDSSF